MVIVPFKLQVLADGPGVGVVDEPPHATTEPPRISAHRFIS
jgi:hypothetical protein